MSGRSFKRIFCAPDCLPLLQAKLVYLAYLFVPRNLTLAFPDCEKLQARIIKSFRNHVKPPKLLTNTALTPIFAEESY
jgi:hypothetical protein